MSDRRYQEEEVRRIFKLATSERLPKASTAPTQNGLTLVEIQSIGAEVGVDAEMLARAAAVVDSGAAEHVRHSFGAPVEVGLTVPLPRAITDHEWEQLVALLRSTFKARGEITEHGGLREWRNGNLHASHEPFGNGYRLRLGTTRGDAVVGPAVGFTGIAAAAVPSLEYIMVRAPSLVVPALFATAGVSAFVINWLRLRPWARRRAQQMKQIAASVKAMMTPTASQP